MTGPRIREHPEDFIVDEIATVEPVDDGDHLLLQVEATDLDHHSMVQRLARAHGVDGRAVGWGGMKDKRAITRQWVTVKTDRDAAMIDDSDLKVREAMRCRRRRRPGALLGNRFEITVRGVEPTLLLQVMPKLESIAHKGLPNRFGPQRFGHRGVNPLLGRAMLAGDHEQLLRIWLGQEGPPFDDRELDRRQCFDQGRFEEALQGWPPSWHAERLALSAMHATGQASRAVAKVPGRIRKLWVDALQSMCFNAVLDHREANGMLFDIGEDDVVSVFTRFHDEVGDDEGPDRTATGPMFGRRMRSPGPSVAALEHTVLEAQGLTAEQFNEGRAAPGGARRPLMVPVLRASAESGVDDRGGFVKVRFSLPRGAYATTVLAALGLG
ncbi:MAG: tRNA pseudouridine(13) synthase TruD [Phycisphaerales bacterium]|nr:tRNA pseudouridine(13) synthase TruD [Phycisphaerales bacterium]